ncbi:hypothetical protein IJ843_06730 [bacterium]|nr:hypothetical protein [bacterium]
MADEDFKMNQKHVKIQEDFLSGVWSERVLVVTQDYEIKGYVFMPKTGKKNRVLSDILNGIKRFVAIKDCEIKHRLIPERKTEYHNFLQLNLSSIILLRPLSDED